MAKSLVEKRYLALQLRDKGMSYSQIKSILGVSKGSLSLWLRHLPLSREQINILRAFSAQRIERYRNTMARKRAERLEAVYRQEKQRLLPLSNKELLIAGLFLYWGEGGKTQRFEISLSNTDPRILQFFIFWLEQILDVPREKIIVRLHLYADMDPSAETLYWGQTLTLPSSQFRKPYIKRTTLQGLTSRSFGHGTCNVIVRGRDYYETVMQGISVIAEDCLSSALTGQ